MTAIIPCLSNVAISYRFGTLLRIQKHSETFMEEKDKETGKGEKWSMIVRETDFGRLFDFLFFCEIH
ncbi:hypothetical protein NPIL_522431 [Nephila pilipes]|uniref:Uncharacterized protein n=1 Tax=Nephila pilipes TaxID=299642 RepID=A0A8X6PVS8_NEPPI|nr:hypothetical protein NPIL_522431 [Nephila pilipes]